VRLAVFDLLGREIRVLASGDMEPGSHTVTWDGRTSGGREAGTGAYFYRIEADGPGGTRLRAQHRMLLIK
jgi:flagellar hook assembly protein FlgD